MQKFCEKYELLIWTMVLVIGTAFDVSLWSGIYIDTDTYMRGLRLIDFIHSPSFFETVFWQSNYPFGEILHWTRPMDILWLINILPFAFATENVKDAVFLGGIFLSPILLILTYYAFIIGIRPYFNVWIRFGAGFFLMLQYSLIGVYVIGRPDHHSLMGLLSMIAFSAFLLFLNDGKLKRMTIAGAIIGLSVWVAIEGLILCVGFLLFLLCLYVFYDKDLKAILNFSGAFFVSVFLAWGLNPPYQGYFYPDNGRISVLFVVSAFLMFLSFFITAYLNPKTKLKKILYIAVLGAVSLLVVYVIFGESIFYYPTTKELRLVWANRILEMLPAYKDTELLIVLLVEPIIVIITGIFLWVKEKDLRPLCLLNLIMLGIFAVLTITAVRFGMYAGVFSCFLPFLFLLYLTEKSKEYKTEGKTPDKVVYLSFFFFFLPIILSIANDAITENKDEKRFERLPYEYLLKGKGSVLSDVFEGPEIIWHTNRTVIGTPYHRNVEGITDSYKMLFSTDKEEVKNLFKKHKVGDVFFTFPFLKNYYKAPEKNTDKLYGQIITGKNIPEFLEKVEIYGKKTILYRVNEKVLNND